MSKGELWKGVAIRLMTAGVFGVIGFFAISFALQMVGTFGEGMGIDARSRELYADSHKIVHLFGAACGLAIGIFGANGNKLLKVLAICALIACGSYGILNMYGFTSTNRVAVAAIKDAQKGAAERAYENARKDLMAQIEWLKKTAVNEEGRERRKLLSEVDAKRKELSELKPPVPTAETILSDPQSTTLADLTGTTARNWLLTLPAALAVLMFMVESLSFIFVGHMLMSIIGMLAGYSAGAGRANTGSGGGGGKLPDNVHTLKRPDPPALQAHTQDTDETPKVSNADASVSASAPPQRPVNNQGQRAYPRKKFLEDEAKADLQRILDATRTQPSQETLAELWGVSQATVSRWLTKWDGLRTKGLARIFMKSMHAKGEYGGLQSLI